MGCFRISRRCNGLAECRNLPQLKGGAPLTLERGNICTNQSFKRLEWSLLRARMLYRSLIYFLLVWLSRVGRLADGRECPFTSKTRFATHALVSGDRFSNSTLRNLDVIRPGMR